MEISQPNSMSDDSNSNFEDCMQLINSITVIAANKLVEVIRNNAKECNDGTSNPCETVITETEKSVDSSKDNKIKQTVTNSNVTVDSSEQILSKSDGKAESIKGFASNVKEIPTCSEETSKEIIDIDSQNMICNSRQESDLLNIATLTETEPIGSLKEHGEIKTKSYSNISTEPLEKMQLVSADEIQINEYNDVNLMEVNSISEKVSNVNSEDKCSEPTEFQLNSVNGSNERVNFSNILSEFDDKNENSDSKLNSNLAENMNLDVGCEVLEVISVLKDNCLVEKDVEINKISGYESKQVTVSKLLASEKSHDTAICSQPEKKTNADSYRAVEDTWTDDDESSTSSSSDESSSDSEFFQQVVESSSGPKTVPEIKTRGELGLDDLPPIEDLTITLPKEDMMLIGVIHAVVEKLVVVHALKDMKPLDIDSVLFLTHERPLGRIFDVFGPVVEPFYTVRFNNIEDIKDKLVEVGAYVFFAPKKDDITSYVFVDELQKEKGSDASWKFNNEPPEECLDFSDDEQEKAARRNRIMKKRNELISSSSDLPAKRSNLISDSGSQPNFNYRPKRFASSRTSNNISIHPQSTPFSGQNSSNTHSSPSPTVSNVFRVPRAHIFSSPYPPCPPSASPSVSNVFEPPRFTCFSSPYPSHSPVSPTTSISTVFETPRFTHFPCPYPSHPPLSPTPSISTVFETPRFTRFSSPYPSHPPISPAPSISTVFEAPRFIPYSSPYPSQSPVSPSPSITSIPEAPRFIPYSTPYLSDPPPPSISNVPEASRFIPCSSPYPSHPPSPTPSVCSVMSVAVRARTPSNFSMPQQPRSAYPQNPHASVLQNTRPFLPQNASPIQRPLQHIIPAFPLQTLPQRPVSSPALPYQQAHVFGQVTLMSPMATLQSPMPPPPPPPMQSFTTPPSVCMNFTTPPPVSMQSFIHPSAPLRSHVPPQFPLTVQIPNSNSPSMPVINNMMQVQQPTLY